MTIAFEKYQGTGNDFVIIDDRHCNFPESQTDLVNQLCDRKFGVGSDGLMLIRNSDKADFEMIFYNPDGSKSLCGNGSRCAVFFANRLGMISNSGKLTTTDGLHDFKIEGDTISIKMHDVNTFSTKSGHRFINTGSPHLIVNVVDVADVDVVNVGRQWRNNPEFIDMGGCNVNFVSPGKSEEAFDVRTYERGVENETLSCGTGVTAVALALALDGKVNKEVLIHTRGGDLGLSFTMKEKLFSDIWLTGPAAHVFSGVIDA